MSLTTKEHLSLVLKTIKNLLSFKADKSEVPVIPDALELVTELNLVSPVAADDGSIYTDENGCVYTL